MNNIRTNNALYPRQTPFIYYCIKEQHLKKATAKTIDSVIFNFWNYYVANSINEASINNVSINDVRDYLTQLEIKEGLKTRTINKYISYLKKYFIFLTEANYISSYPLYSLKGRSFNRKQTIIINWMDHLSELPIEKLHINTVKLLVLTSAGYDVDQLMQVRWHQILNHLHDNRLRNYLQEHLIFEKTDDPIIFQSKTTGGQLHNLQAVLRPTLLDQEKLTLELKPKKLHQSYMISKVADQQATDASLMSDLNINRSTLTYYQTCVNYYNLVDFQSWQK